MGHEDEDVDELSRIRECLPNDKVPLERERALNEDVEVKYLNKPTTSACGPVQDDLCAVQVPFLVEDPVREIEPVG